MPPAVPEVVRSLIIGNQTVAYQLRRSQRRTIGLAIDQRGLRVGAPSRARLDDIEALIRQHGQWVLDKLAAWQERAAPPQEITDGTVIPLLGEP
jgi:predicted metal-dependent hydrolase